MTNADPQAPSVTRAVFVVRLWWEAGNESVGPPGEWRGSVELLGGGQREYFRQLSDIGALIATQLKNIQPLSYPDEEEK